MVNWTDPTNILLQSLVLVKSIHFLDGFFFWQFFTTLSFEFEFLRGKRNPEWPLAINCSAWNKVVLLFSYLGVTLSSGLFISQMRAAAVVLPCLLTLAAFGMMLHEICKAQSVWSPTNFTCANINTTTRNINIISLVVYFSIFITYTVGVYVNAKSFSKKAKPTYELAILFTFLPFLIQTLPVMFSSTFINYDIVWPTNLVACSVPCATEMYWEICDPVSPIIGKHSLAIGVSYFSTTQNSGLAVRLPTNGSIPLISLDRSNSEAGANSKPSKI
ncbi:hypothetical protein BDQ17DRAFT_1329731 [Cyathus striatus]|nr:hypothetical protein BDQ17DRAFT_1329731 [Cyathus striatus]